MALSESAKISTRARKAGKTAKSTEQFAEAFAKAESSAEATESKSKIRSMMKDNAFFVKVGAAFTAFGGFVKEKAAAAKQSAINFGHDFSVGYTAYKESRAARIEESNLSAYKQYLEERGYSVTERTSTEEQKVTSSNAVSASLNADGKSEREAIKDTETKNSKAAQVPVAATEQAAEAKTSTEAQTPAAADKQTDEAKTATTTQAPVATTEQTTSSKSTHSVSRCVEELNNGRDNGIVDYLREIIDVAQQYINQSQSENGTQLQDIDTVTKVLQRGGRFMYDVRKGYVDSITAKETESAATAAREASSESASL